MKKVIAIAAVVLFAFQFSYAQIPVEQYRKEIQNLKTKGDIWDYWQKLMAVDQETMSNVKDLAVGDSIFIDNMVHITLMVDILKEKVVVPNYAMVLPAITFTHSHTSATVLAFWPVLQEYQQYGSLFNYPSYQLEVVFLKFYNYSLFSKTDEYPRVIAILNKKGSSRVLEDLLSGFEYTKKLRKLTTVKVLDTWKMNDSVNPENEEDVFTFRKMSDGNLYLESRSNLQKLNLVTTKGNTKIYRIENEPMGWTYKYEANGNLSLLDENNKTLVAYHKAIVN